jgi:hypothetical protein
MKYVYEFREYAIDRIDEAIHLLDVLLELRDELVQTLDEVEFDRVVHKAVAPDVKLHPALALTTMGRLIAEIADGIREGEKGGDEVEHPSHDLDEAVDLIDGVIAAYQREDEE